MGAQTSLIKPLQALLKARKLKVSERTLEGFIKEVDRHAPWYVVSGSLTPRSWEKLGKDLQRAKERDRLSPGVMPLWRLIRACLEDDRCKEAVTQGRDCLQLAQDSLSETERGERIGTKVKEKGESPERVNSEEKRSLYPTAELEKLKVASSSSLDSETSDTKRGSKLERNRQRRRKGERVVATLTPPSVAPLVTVPLSTVPSAPPWVFNGGLWYAAAHTLENSRTGLGPPMAAIL